MNFEDVQKIAEENPVLVRSLEEALRRNAGGEELAEILRSAGMGTESVEGLLAEYQRKRGAAVSTERVDKESLHMVAGGSYNCGNCTETYYTQDCAATVESNSWCGSNDSCLAYSEVYTCVARNA